MPSRRNSTLNQFFLVPRYFRAPCREHTGTVSPVHNLSWGQVKPKTRLGSGKIQSFFLHFLRMRVPSYARKGLAYVINGGLYLSLTNFAPCTTLVASRGPGFQMPPSSGFELLPDGDENLPKASELALIIDDVYRDLEIVGMGENDPGVSFTGLGDPLTELDTLLETVALVKERRHGVGFSVTTSGLFDACVPFQLFAGGVKHVCVSLNAASPACNPNLNTTPAPAPAPAPPPNFNPNPNHNPTQTQPTKTSWPPPMARASPMYAILS